MSWFGRARRASAGQRVTRADQRDALDAVAEINRLNADRQRLMREGIAGVATIVGIHENVAATTLGTWHELELDVRLPDDETYRATRRIALELSRVPRIRVGAEVPVRVDPRDKSKVLVVEAL